jgi:NADPH-dependent 2,4-dienoyl-CoA reductase/sulfur reductase-like enzyme
MVKTFPIPLNYKRIGIVAVVTVFVLIIVPSPILVLISSVYLAQLYFRLRNGPVGQPDYSSSERPRAIADLVNLTPRVAIIGSGYAGLSAASAFHAAKIPYIVLEKSSQAGESWFYRYSRLHLHRKSST